MSHRLGEGDRTDGAGGPHVFRERLHRASTRYRNHGGSLHPLGDHGSGEVTEGPANVFDLHSGNGTYDDRVDSERAL